MVSATACVEKGWRLMAGSVALDLISGLFLDKIVGMRQIMQVVQGFHWGDSGQYCSHFPLQNAQVGRV